MSVVETPQRFAQRSAAAILIAVAILHLRAFAAFHFNQPLRSQTVQVAKDKVVSMDYTLTDSAGTTLDSSTGRPPLSYLHGAENIIPGLERKLEGKTIGDQIQATIEPSDGYGERRDELQQQVGRENFANVPDLAIGMQFRVPTNDDSFVVVTVVEMDDANVTIDGNHPLAGVTLHFDVTIRDIRDATTEELEHGHAHGAGGHEH